jgi:LysR family transcriptional regulator, benzoate and cis,cis-muconate-responsive activator of ben and cat genes
MCWSEFAGSGQFAENRETEDDIPVCFQIVINGTGIASLAVNRTAGTESPHRPTICLGLEATPHPIFAAQGLCAEAVIVSVVRETHGFPDLGNSNHQRQVSMQSKNPLEVNILIVVIAQEGNFIRASKKLGITPPSLTRKVASLERSIGVKLFDRSTRSVELTAAGRLFVQESSLSLSHAERAWDLARFQAQIESGPYRIGYSPYTHSAFLPLLNGLSPVPHPPGDEPSGIVLEPANTLELVERVLRGKLHAALGVAPIADRDLWIQRVGHESFSVCLPRNHRLAHRIGVTAHDLDREMVFWMPRALQPRFYERVMKYISSLGVQPVFREVAGATHALQFAAQGFGIALLPRSAAHISYSGIVFKPLADRYLGIETVLFMRRDQRYGKLKEIIDDFFRQLLALKISIN